MDNDFAEITVLMPWGHVSGRWYGDQKQRPLIALHGWLDNCGTFARLAPLLQPHTSVLCIDLPGHGYSTHLPAGIIYTHMEFVRVLLRLMKAYKWEKISLLGHSMGGTVAFYFAALYPHCVDMLIGLDIIVERAFEIETVPILIRHIMDRAVVDNERILRQTPMHEPPSYTYEECERLLYEGSEHSVLLENCKYLLERNLSKSPKYPNKFYFSRDGRLKYMATFNPSMGLIQCMISRICRNSIPHLVVRGSASTNTNANTILETVPFCESQNANFEVYTVADGTHHLHLNNPTEVADVIIDFWKRKNWLQYKDAKVGHDVGDVNVKLWKQSFNNKL